jgi:hypothetical protein
LRDWALRRPNRRRFFRSGSRGGSTGVAGLPLSRIQPSCWARGAQSEQTSFRSRDGARYGSVRSPFNIVRPQTSQATCSSIALTCRFI